MDLNDIAEFLKGGALPTILIGICGYFLKKEAADAKEVRTSTSANIEEIKKTLSGQNTEIAVIKSQLKNHIENDEKIQEHIDKNITEIKLKLKVA